MSDPVPKGSDAMKATLTDARFSDPDWIFERKLDGIRCVAVRDGGATQLLSRNDLALSFPEVAEALDAQPRTRFAVDGELVAFEGDQTSFAKLARRGQEAVRASTTSSTCCGWTARTSARARCASASSCCAPR
jgi:bifunctional non-homologous end joining protein LigD